MKYGKKSNGVREPKPGRRMKGNPIKIYKYIIPHFQRNVKANGENSAKRKAAKKAARIQTVPRSFAHIIGEVRGFNDWCSQRDEWERERKARVRAEHTVCKGGWDKMSEEEFQKARRATI